MILVALVIWRPVSIHRGISLKAEMSTLCYIEESKIHSFKTCRLHIHTDILHAHAETQIISFLPKSKLRAGCSAGSKV